MESSKTVGIRKDLIEMVARRVKVGVCPPASALSIIKTYADGVPENRIIHIPDKRSPWDGLHRMFGEGLINGRRRP